MPHPLSHLTPLTEHERVRLQQAFTRAGASEQLWPTIEALQQRLYDTILLHTPADEALHVQALAGLLLVCRLVERCAPPDQPGATEH